MRESIGGTMLFWIVLFFLSIFIFFLASVIRYARVYKIKNSLINYIERSEGIESRSEIENKLTEFGYDGKNSYVVCRFSSTDSSFYTGVIYKVLLYADFELPILGKDIVHIGVKIKGETRSIKTGTKITKAAEGLFSPLVESKEECVTCNMGVSGECSKLNGERINEIFG